jgi:hypothetical protein
MAADHDSDVDLTSSEEEEEEQQQQEAQAAASPAGSPEMRRGFSRDGEPVRPTSDKQLTRSQVRKMVRIQLKILKRPADVSDDWIDSLFDEFDSDRSGLIEDGEWDSLVAVLKTRPIPTAADDDDDDLPLRPAAGSARTPTAHTPAARTPRLTPQPTSPGAMTPASVSSFATARSSEPRDPPPMESPSSLEPAPELDPEPAPEPTADAPSETGGGKEAHTPEADAIALFNALNAEGADGIDTRTLGKVIVARTDDELQAVKRLYGRKFNRTLVGQLNKSVDGEYRNFLVKRLAHRNDNTRADRALAVKQAKRIVEAADTGMNLEQLLVEIFGAAPPWQIAEVKAAYQFQAELSGRLEGTAETEEPEEPETLVDLIRRQIGDSDLGWSLMLLLLYSPDEASQSEEEAEAAAAAAEGETQAGGVGTGAGRQSPKRKPKRRLLSLVQTRELIRSQLKEQGYSAEAIAHVPTDWIDGVFHEFDRDGSGLIDDGEWEEIVVVLRSRQPPVSQGRVAEIIEAHSGEQARLEQSLAEVQAQLARERSKTAELSQTNANLQEELVEAADDLKLAEAGHELTIKAREEDAAKAAGQLLTTTEHLEAYAERAAQEASNRLADTTARLEAEHAATKASHARELGDTKEALEAELRHARLRSDAVHSKAHTTGSEKDETIRFLREKVQTQAELTSVFHNQIAALKVRCSDAKLKLTEEQEITAGLRAELAKEQSEKCSAQTELLVEQEVNATLKGQQETLSSEVFQHEADAVDREEVIAGLEVDVASYRQKYEDQQVELGQSNTRNTQLLKEVAAVRSAYEQQQAELNQKTRAYDLLKGTRFTFSPTPSSPSSSPTSTCTGGGAGRGMSSPSSPPNSAAAAAASPNNMSKSPMDNGSTPMTTKDVSSDNMGAMGAMGAVDSSVPLKLQAAAAAYADDDDDYDDDFESEPI